MPEKLFILDPATVKEAVLKGKCLLVHVHGDRHQYHAVTLCDRPTKLRPSNEARAA